MSEHDVILIALRRIIRAVDIRSRELERETGLTAPQLVLLQALGREAEATPKSLSRAVSLSPPTVTAILDRLERAGLVTRRRSPRDGRSVIAELTPAGREAVSAAPELLQAGFLRAFRRAPEWEQHMIIAALQRVAEMMDCQDVDAAPILERSGDVTQAAGPDR
ncbi:MarR family transcriptional regulator [Alkalicaulis satelles]|uniref:MarR family transcriptional regulator n=1 Tax=Alkalicaulis satelles TaxID=2609175 RepID=A0A5M6ZCK7_9PROT|nr:MarR family transcriptional regulator [Alkalicaulis satelles]KAA5801634.1 MarR family transcriptional regulator [Alkalicaulis satelles]